MEIKIKLSVAVLVFSMFVVIILSNVGCECREFVSLASHSSFLKASYKSQVDNRKAWCGNNQGTCSQNARGRGYTHGKWECCSKKYCADVSSDSNNCGKCGHACGYGLSCCKGKCVDLNTNKDNCGSCSNRCHHEKCEFGICGYASGYGYSNNNQAGTLGN